MLRRLPAAAAAFMIQRRHPVPKAAVMHHVHLFLVEGERLAVWLVLLCAVLVPLERTFSLRPATLLRRGVRVDLCHYFLNSLAVSFLVGVPMAMAAAIARELLPQGVHAAIAAMPGSLRLVLAFAVGETGFYWGHRLAHEWPPLWRFHAVHHGAEHMDFLVNTRAHPVDLLAVRLCGLVPLCVLGLAGPGAIAGTAVPAAVSVVGAAWGFLVHANVRLRFGPLEQVLASPAFHHWHHTLHAPIGRNYAAMLPLLDRLFGTLHLPPGWPEAYGLDGGSPATLAGQLAAPFLGAEAVVSGFVRDPMVPALRRDTVHSKVITPGPTGHEEGIVQ
jgi:sterol desaturase/sphingolipid hydroxylase (fatty acid hydroxylase superfamily)